MNRNRTIIKRKQFFECHNVLMMVLLVYTLYETNYVAIGLLFLVLLAQGYPYETFQAYQGLTIK